MTGDSIAMTAGIMPGVPYVHGNRAYGKGGATPPFPKGVVGR